ncbi:calpain-like cysteine peptidase [Novymonas esmeraldas]|uniref:Calpain-like cysteine peptidase n=1 Tax=Novymonas esmeraldas TaxID=1808958 RepID=A0AAW0EPE5_9TRYP
MDGNTIRATCDEDFVTDAMLEEYLHEMTSSASFLDDRDLDAAAATAVGPAARAPGTTVSMTAPFALGLVTSFSAGSKGARHRGADHHSGLDCSDASIVRRVSHRVSTSVAAPVELSRSEITSDDSGDFAFLTSDVRDADAYDLLRHYVVHCKQQEKDLAELEAECARLEAEQQQLYGTAVAVGMARRASHTSLGAPRPPRLDVGPHTGNSGGGVSSPSAPDDEFGESHIDPVRACPYARTADGVSTKRSYRYGHPAIAGRYTPVFKGGLLYRCTTDDGAWVFYNDSQQFKMQVKYVMGASSTITAGPHATVETRSSGEHEVQVMVCPQETEVLLTGTVNGFKNYSTAVEVDTGYVNPHAVATTRAPRALLNHYAHQLGKSSISLLTVDDVLECCTSSGVASVATSAAATSAAAAPHFVDPDFPPSSASIHRRNVDELFLWDMPWRRPAEYLPATHAAEACLFARAVLPTDPSPGDGGDAYLCSAASILAEHPAQVARLFRHPTSTAAGRCERAVGAYRVSLCHGGWWTPTALDSYLPSSLKGPDLGRCAHDLRKLWYPLLEKAYAKLHGSYAAIQCGDPLEALQDFTGFPTLRLDEEWAEAAQSRSLPGIPAEEGSSYTTPAKQLFTFVEERVHQRGYLVCLSLSDEEAADTPAVQMGMVPGMSYTVLRVVRHGRFRLVQIRCPTLTPDAGGQWGADSARWQEEPELARLCGMDGGGVAEPAAMWLEWSAALTTFESGGVCCSRWDWAYDCRVRGTFADGVPSIVLEVSVVGAAADAAAVEGYCLLSQEDDRGLPPDHPNRSLCPLMLCVSSHYIEGAAEEEKEAREGDGERGHNSSGSGAPSPVDQKVRHVCSTDPDAPTDQLNFILGRDTALRVTLAPSPHPYYIIPRSLGEMANKLYTVGFVSATAVTKTGTLRIRPVQLPPQSSVFYNWRTFSTEKLESVAAAAFQVRGPDGRVRVGCGSSIG